MFIVIEGIDGSGKTSLSNNLVNKLDELGKSSIRFSEPTSFESGKYIRKFLKGEIVLSKKEQIDAFLFDREISVSKNIKPALQDNKIVVLDRYYYSTAAYQASKDFSPQEILNLNLEKKFPKPDLLFFINLQPEIAFKRISSRDNQKEIFESIDELTKINSNFHVVLPSSKIILDGLLSEEELVSLCLKHILV